MEDFYEINLFQVERVKTTIGDEMVVVVQVVTMDKRKAYGVLAVEGALSANGVIKFTEDRQYARYFFTGSVAKVYAEAYANYLRYNMDEQDYLDMNSGYNYSEFMNLVTR
ncbi:hypothetical protein AVT69_gp125 [Pseudomonas phage PhiPA3]|uniref:Uncharacterized protein 126 n=1 Tax=Pseudomonas phage PhiPA3 TaxID=998086 RepID=F8SK00_BPPA3|nr:hypothetical protein AVT69_gp125 [Pseudomonas phage PhiPA3]AEH03550.1 hypothetical protein [Pseudomonas phage PhiPA3]